MYRSFLNTDSGHSFNDCMNVRSTLVAAAPTLEGLIFAADSRSTVAGLSFDNTYKIIEPSRPSRTVFSVTGNGTFVSTPPPGTDLATYIKTAPRILDIDHVVRTSISSFETVTRHRIERDVGRNCLHATIEFRNRFPRSLDLFRGQELFAVVVGSYAPKERKSTIASFTVRILSSLEPEIMRFQWKEVLSRDRRDCFYFGETHYVDTSVVRGVGSQFIKQYMSFFSEPKQVAETPKEDALRAVINLIDGTSKTTALVPPPTGIGGPIDAVLLGNDDRPTRLCWK